VRCDPSRSSTVNDFHFTWKPTSDFLLVIRPNSNLGRTSHRLATIGLHSLQTTTDGRTRPISQRHDQFSVKKHFPSPPFNPKFENVSLALHSVIFVCREPRANSFPYDPTFSHNTSVTDDRQTDRRTRDTSCHRRWPARQKLLEGAALSWSVDLICHVKVSCSKSPLSKPFTRWRHWRKAQCHCEVRQN